MTCFRLKSGQTLYSYCKENNLPYDTLFPYCDRDGLPPDEAIELYQKWKNDGTITNHRRGNQRLYYDGKPLKKYCQAHDLSYTTILAKLRIGYSIEELITKHFKKGKVNETKKIIKVS